MLKLVMLEMSYQELKYAVVGVGAVGTLIAYSLNNAGITPYLVFRNKERVEMAENTGVHIIVRNREPVRISGIYATVEDLKENELDVVFIATKAYDAPKAFFNVLPKLKKNGVVVTCQNGLGTFEMVTKALGLNRSLALVLNCGVHKRDSCNYVFVGCNESYLGGHSEQASMPCLVDALHTLNVNWVSNIEPFRWLKLAVNSAINPVTALLRVKNGIILSNDYVRSIAFGAAAEVSEVANKLGIKLPKDPRIELLRVAEATRNNLSSMLQDVLAGRRTEIDFINGVVAARARHLGIAAKINETLWYLVKALERSRADHP